MEKSPTVKRHALSKHLATVGRNNSPLTERNLWKNQAQGGESIFTVNPVKVRLSLSLYQHSDWWTQEKGSSRGSEARGELPLWTNKLAFVNVQIYPQISHTKPHRVTHLQTRSLQIRSQGTKKRQFEMAVFMQWLTSCNTSQLWQ